MGCGSLERSLASALLALSVRVVSHEITPMCSTISPWFRATNVRHVVVVATSQTNVNAPARPATSCSYGRTVALLQTINGATLSIAHTGARRHIPKDCGVVSSERGAEGMSYYDALPPWRHVPRCADCSQVASRRLTRDGVFTCQAHTEQRHEQQLSAVGSSSSTSARRSWQYWTASRLYVATHPMKRRKAKADAKELRRLFDAAS